MLGLVLVCTAVMVAIEIAMQAEWRAKTTPAVIVWKLARCHCNKSTRVILFSGGSTLVVPNGFNAAIQGDHFIREGEQKCYQSKSCLFQMSFLYGVRGEEKCCLN